MKRLKAEVDYGQLVSERGGVRRYERTVTVLESASVVEWLNFSEAAVVNTFVERYGEFKPSNVHLDADDALVTVYVGDLAEVLQDSGYLNEPGKLFFRVTVGGKVVTLVNDDDSTRVDVEPDIGTLTFTYAGEKQ